MNNRKHVLIIRSNPVDPDPRVEKEADSLLEAGYTVDVFCWDRGSDHPVTSSIKTLSHGSVNIYRIGIAASFGAGFRKNLRPLIRFQIEILRFIRRHYRDYDVLHVCDFDTALAGYIGSRGRQLKLIYDIFDYYADAFGVPDVLKKLVIGLDTHVINHADGVIICSEQRKSQLRGARPGRLSVIHNSPRSELKLIEVEHDTSHDHMRIAYIGILNDGRLIPELLEIVSRHSEFELHIAGFGKYEDLCADFAGSNDNITYYGRTEYAQTLEIESRCDVMTAVYDPSIRNHRYAAPNKFYEALMLGKPVIMCRGTGFADVVEDNEIGICIDYSEESLEKGLEYLSGNLERFRSRRNLERELYRKQYSWDIMSERLRALYESVL